MCIGFVLVKIWDEEEVKREDLVLSTKRERTPVGWIKIEPDGVEARRAD
jgi:hypothetical protein